MTYFGEDLYFGEATFFGGPPLGTEFLTKQLGPYARLAVEMAFGANLDLTVTDPATDWIWADVTADVRMDPAIAITIGRGDENGKAQPAKCRLTLDNRAGHYSLGAQSPNHPYVRRNVPLRVSVKIGAGGQETSGFYPGSYPGSYPGAGEGGISAGDEVFHPRFVGYVDELAPGWDITGRDAVVEVTASGILRRLQQGHAPLRSPARRAIPRLPGLVAYWPCEDGPGAVTVTAGMDGVQPMSIIGAPAFGKSDEIKLSDPLPLINNATLSAPIPNYLDTGQLQVRMLISKRDEGTYDDDFASLLTVYLTGSIAQITVYANSVTGAVGCYALPVGSATRTFPFGSDIRIGDFVDQPAAIGLNLIQAGADFTVELSYYYPGANEYHPLTGAVTGHTFGKATRIVIHGNPVTQGALRLLGFGHLFVRNQAPASEFGAAFGYQGGELATTRIARLTVAESGIPLTVYGNTSSGALTTMGAQTSTDLMTLLREAETVEQGILFDGMSPGLTYVVRNQKELVYTMAMTLNVANGELAQELTPVYDDQGVRNSWEVTRQGAGTHTFTDTDGPMGTTTIGIYDSSMTINVNSDSRAQDYAGWLVHLGTDPGYRYPRINLNFAAQPQLVPSWVECVPGRQRLQLINCRGVRTQLPTDTIELHLQGYTEKLSRFEWSATLNCSSAERWRVARYAIDGADPEPLALRAASDGSVLAAAAAVGDTLLTVSTPTGPLWTTDPNDFPLHLDIGGHDVVCTAVTGTTNPQAFTVSAMPGVVFPGIALRLWEPAVPGI